MILEKKDYYEIAALMNREGGEVEYEKEKETLYFDYDVDVDGYVEDDYYCGYGNGTGAWVTTDVTVKIANIECCNSDGKDVDCNFDENKMANIYEHELMN